MSDILCENCINYAYDEEYEEYVCNVNIDEDEMSHLMSTKYRKCPYFRFGDDYTIVKKQN
ncbi:MAG: hypothetical protein IKU15_01675 [Clostridia bacterium]|nr:hypothetical protein [Clostridia bacterium]